MSKQSPVNPIIAGVIVFMVAVGARLGTIGRTVTPDEFAWVNRSIQFRKALLSADWGQTIQAPHPGVIPTWLTTIGIQLTLLFDPNSYTDLAIAENLAWAHSQTGDVYTHLIPFLTSGRLLVIVVFALGICSIYHILDKRFGQPLALLAALFLSLDPWIVGLSSVLHVDALMGLFTCLTILLILSAETVTTKRLVVAGLFTALAFLTKLPGMILLGFVPVLLIAQTFREPAFNLARTFQQIAIWLLACIVASILFLPALLVDPQGVYELVFANGAQEINIQIPIFFMGSGRADVGSIFYPVAILIRQSPLVTVGLIIGALQIIKQRTATEFFWLGEFALFSLVFWLGISISSREFTRYMIPVSMLMTISAGLSFGQVIKHWTNNNRRFFVPILIALQISWMAWFWATPLSAANLFTGGPWRLQNQLPAGWADGVSQAAAHAATLPDAENKRLFTTNVPAAAPFFPGEVLRLIPETSNLIRPIDYVLIDQNTVQLDGDRSAFNGQTPIHTTKLNQVETAWLFSNWDQSSPSTTQEISVRFGPQLTLKQSTIFQPENHNHIVIQTEWEHTGQQSYQIISQIIDPQGNVWAVLESPLVANSGLPAGAWPSGTVQSYFASHHLPADVPPGHYTVAVEIFDASGKRLGVFNQDGQFQGIQAKLGELAYSPRPNFEPSSESVALTLSHPNLLAIAQPPERIGQGESIKLDAWIKKSSLDQQNLKLLINNQMIDFEVDTQAWPTDSIYKVKAQWFIPADFPTGTWPVSIQLGSTIADLGTIQVDTRNRLFELPADIVPLNIQLQETALLQQLSITVDQEILIQPVWQSLSASQTDYTMFIHIKEASGNIIHQVDRPPIKPTSLWVNGEVILDEIKLPLAENSEQVSIGLYDPTTGQRIPVYSAEGEQLPDGQFTVELSEE